MASGARASGHGSFDSENMQREEDKQQGSKHPLPEGKSELPESEHSAPEGRLVPPEEGREDRPGRRYGLFGVSAYPEKSRMGEKQRASMSRWLGVVIGLMAMAVVVMLFLTPLSSGLTVTFDTLGGSQVPSQSVQYGGTLEPPEETVRPGYRLVGWSIAPEGEALWDFETDTVMDTLTLYAVWEPEEESEPDS